MLFRSLPFPAKHKSALLWFSISLLSIKCGALSRFKRCFAGNSGVKNYDAELINRGVDKENIHHYGFAFKGKEVLIDGR